MVDVDLINFLSFSYLFISSKSLIFLVGNSSLIDPFYACSYKDATIRGWPGFASSWTFFLQSFFSLTSYFWNSFGTSDLPCKSLGLGDECDFVREDKRFLFMANLWMRRLMWDYNWVLNNIEFASECTLRRTKSGTCWSPQFYFFIFLIWMFSVLGM
jgi:hypothetical protein